ncbi:MAG: STAS-like domain-containing protein [Scytonema sp. PMC 1069.18]|nr:STAS-like domain-containing protein [Scytonema sp. PMC 1069.18]MEC4884218.1 STAS-like domain-containing protein [Scytonema sp. PMC 1070.18]
MTIKIYDLVGQYAITADGGQKVYDQIHPKLLAGYQVELDFTGVKVFASPFFNFAIGQLLKDIAADDLNRLLKFTALNDNGQNVLERVIANSKEYYSNPQYREAVDKVLEEYVANF